MNTKQPYNIVNCSRTTKSEQCGFVCIMFKGELQIGEQETEHRHIL